MMKVTFGQLTSGGSEAALEFVVIDERNERIEFNVTRETFIVWTTDAAAADAHAAADADSEAVGAISGIMIIIIIIMIVAAV